MALKGLILKSANDLIFFTVNLLLTFQPELKFPDIPFRHRPFLHKQGVMSQKLSQALEVSTYTKLTYYFKFRKQI